MKKYCSLVLMFSLLAFLQPDLSMADRPLTVEEAGTMEPWEFEFETGLEWQGRRSSGVLAQSMVLAFGFLPGWEFEVESAYQWLRDSGSWTGGWLDTPLRLRWEAWNPGNWTVGAIGEVTLPTGKRADDFGSGNVGLGLIMVATWESGAWGTDLNLGYGWDDPGRGFNDEDEWFAGVAGRRQLNDQWTVVSEITTEWSHGDFRDAEWGWLAGVRCEICEGWVLDAGAGIRFGDEEPVAVITAGLTVEF